MCPVASPVGPERAAPASDADVRFSRPAVCRILGVAPSWLERLAQMLAEEARHPLAASLTFPELLSIFVVSQVWGRLGGRAETFAVGFGQAFAKLSACNDPETLGDQTLVVGPDFARLAKLRSDHVSCAGDEFVIVELRPILQVLRDLAFA